MCDINYCKYECNKYFDFEKQLEMNKTYNKLNNFDKNEFVLNNVIEISDKSDVSAKFYNSKYKYQLFGQIVCRLFYANVRICFLFKNKLLIK
jgi:hypothetical protein